MNLQSAYRWVAMMPDGREVCKGAAAGAVAIVLIPKKSHWPHHTISGPVVRRFCRIRFGLSGEAISVVHCIEREKDRVWIRYSDGARFVTGLTDDICMVRQ